MHATGVVLPTITGATCSGGWCRKRPAKIIGLFGPGLNHPRGHLEAACIEGSGASAGVVEIQSQDMRKWRGADEEGMRTRRKGLSALKGEGLACRRVNRKTCANGEDIGV